MAPTTLILVGFVFALLAILVSLHTLSVSEARALDTKGEPLWSPWISASTGSGSNGNNEDDDWERPRRPLVIEDFELRRARITRWLLRTFRVPSLDVEDVAQKVIYSAWESRHRYDPSRGRLDSWLLSVVSHHARDYHANAYRRVEPFDPELGPWQQLADPNTPEDLVDEARLRDRALAIMDRLPPHLAVVLVIHDYDGERTVDIAAAMGKHPSTVQNMLVRARTALKKELSLLDEMMKKRDREDEPP